MSFTEPFKIFNSKTTQKIFLILCIPIFIIIIFANVLNSYYMKNYKSLIISNYTKDLNTFLSDTEESMNRIINTTGYFSANSDVMYIINMQTKPSSEDYERTFSAASVLKSVINTSDLIHSAAIYNRSADFVLTQSGLYDTSEYFNEICKYEGYSREFFSTFSPGSSQKKILPPSKIINPNLTTQQTMVPLVFSYSNCLVMLNINMNTLFSNFSAYKVTPNTQIFMIDQATNNCFSEGGGNVDALIPHITKKINSFTYSSSDNFTSGGEKYLSIASTRRSNIWGYIYAVTVPYSDINGSVAKIVLTSAVFLLILFLLLALFAFIGTRQLYEPWENLITLIDSLNIKPKTPQSNLWDYVGSSIFDISQTNKQLAHNLSIALPLSQEKYLIDILNGNLTQPNEELNKVIFKHDYFISISMHISINRSFIANLSMPQAQFLNEIYNAICSIFASYFPTFTLPIEEDALYLLLNLEEDSCEDHINEVIETVRSLFTADADNMNISFYTGGIHKGIDGLKQTHKEAMSTLLKSIYTEKIQVYTKETSEYTFTMNDENTLMNYLIAGYIDKAGAFLNEVFEKSENSSAKRRQEIYTSIIMVLYKVMRTKNIQLADTESGGELELLHSITARPDSEIRMHITEMMDNISSSMQVSKTKIDINELISYINEHYTEDIYLENLAQTYNTSTKYLSKRIKQHLNVPFKEYVTQLRIDKAKELLETTNIKIEDLSKQVGFYNRSTFIRAFKQKAGITPSEYRELYKK